MTKTSGMNRVSAAKLGATAEMRPAAMPSTAVPTTAAMSTAAAMSTDALRQRRRGRQAEREPDHAKTRCNLRHDNPLHGIPPPRYGQRQIAPGVPLHPSL